jgi:serine/threonine protein kinase/WD40 repeat protein
MSAADAPGREDLLPALLAAYDDALAAGAAGTSLDESAAPAELRARLERRAACCLLLRQLLRGAASTAPRTPAEATSVPETVPSSAGLPSLGRFRIHREIGRGAFGVVFHAYDPQLARDVALKVPRAEVLVTPELGGRFAQEARTAAGLEHPNLVPVYEAGQEGPICYIVSAYCPGITLAAWLKAHTDPVPYADAAQLLATLAEAVAHAHQRGVVHRDLKPGNILLRRKSEEPNPKPEMQAADCELRISDFEPKVTDFGLAKLVQDERGATIAGCPTQTGAVLGTPRYMAPEQAGGQSKAVGPAADIYALGVILYEVLTGRPPFQADTALDTLWLVRTQEPLPPARLRPGLPRDLETICLKCLHKEPGRRYASAVALAEDLGRFLRHEPIRAGRPRPLGRLALWGRRNPALAATITVAAVLIGMMAGVSISQVLQERDRYHAEQEKAVANLYQSVVGEARALRLARASGFRAKAWARLEQALALETPGRDPLVLRQQAAACLGDFVGLEPAVWPQQVGGVWFVALAVDPGGGQAAVGMTDGTVALRRLPDGKEMSRLRGHRAGVFAVVFAPEGKVLASADDQGQIKVWDQQPAGAWVCRRTLTTDRSAVPGMVRAHSLCLAPGGHHLFACAKGARAVSCWDLTADGPAKHFPSPGKEPLRAAALSRDARLLAAAYQQAGENGVLLWDVPSRRFLRKAATTLGEVQDLVFSPDGTQLACACDLGTLVLDTAELRTRLYMSSGLVYSLGFSRDGRTLAIPDQSVGVVRLWNVRANREEAVLEHPQEPHSVVFCHEAGTLVTMAAQSVRVWDLHGQGEILALSGHAGKVTDMAFRADGRLLASAGGDKVVRLWDPQTGRLRATLSSSGGLGQSVAFHPDGQTLATADFAGAVRLWDVRAPNAPQELPALAHDAGSLVWCVRFSPDGKYLAVGGARGLTVWRAAPAKGRASWERRHQVKDLHVSNLCFDPGGRWLAWGDYHHDLHVCRLADWQVTVVSAELQGAPHGLAFLPDGKRLLWIAPGTRAAVWEAGAGRKEVLMDVRTAPGLDHYKSGFELALSPDGHWLAVHGSSVTIWDTQTRGLLLALPPEPDAVTCLAWGAGRDRLAVGSANGRLVVWNLPQVRSQLAAIGLGW